MDSIRMEKFHAMKRYRKTKQFRPSLLHYFATLLFLALFLSSPLWLPRACSCLLSLAAISGTKCLVLLCNVVVVFLVRVSASKPSQPSPADIYEEYMNRKVSNELQDERKSKMRTEEEDDSEEEEEVISEIDKKAEDFIARINWQRRLEERRLLSYGYG
ncbi:uncharacterized protein LOC141831260 [Curcuma longa]|uniref:uncharacterized protein LOC141831260 n=1 Tax=Curcuma longa TaxID=136217 RepID=UPI003D9F66C5